ncbi:helix-turn-helix domain-containing protein, partial [Streptomyces sp. NPDC007856]|uniref:helix-turn-helix domain-containing protein n=1 Tax=Streptomyces sp. NPDC007856 TaxID=3364781 RepID=UPI003698B415
MASRPLELPDTQTRQAIRKSVPGLTRSEMAAILNVTPETVANWETRTAPRGEVRDRYLALLHLIATDPAHTSQPWYRAATVNPRIQTAQTHLDQNEHLTAFMASRPLELPDTQTRQAIRKSVPDLTQSAMATILNVTPETVANWETRTAPRGEVRDRYLALLHLIATDPAHTSQPWYRAATVNPRIQTAQTHLAERLTAFMASRPLELPDTQARQAIRKSVPGLILSTMAAILNVTPETVAYWEIRTAPRGEAGDRYLALLHRLATDPAHTSQPWYQAATGHPRIQTAQTHLDQNEHLTAFMASRPLELPDTQTRADIRKSVPGLTQSAMATILNVSQKTVHLWETRTAPQGEARDRYLALLHRLATDPAHTSQPWYQAATGHPRIQTAQTHLAERLNAFMARSITDPAPAGQPSSQVWMADTSDGMRNGLETALQQRLRDIAPHALLSDPNAAWQTVSHDPLTLKINSALTAYHTPGTTPADENALNHLWTAFTQHTLTAGITPAPLANRVFTTPTPGSEAGTLGGALGMAGGERRPGWVWAPGHG